MLSYFCKVNQSTGDRPKYNANIKYKVQRKAQRTKVVQAGEFCDVLTSYKSSINQKRKNMDKKERFAIAKKIAKNERLTKEEFLFVEEDMCEFLKNCVIK